MPLGSQATKNSGFNADHKQEKDSAQNSRSNQPKQTQGLSATAEYVAPASGQTYDKLGGTSSYQRKLRETAGAWSMGNSPEKAGRELDEINYARAMSKIKSRRG